MKKYFTGSGVLIAFFVLVFFSACENADPGPQQLEGSWKLVSAESNVEIKGQKPEMDTVDVSKLDLIFNFKSDGSFSYTSSLSVGEIALEHQTTTSGKFRIEGSELILEFYDTEMQKKAEVGYTISTVSGSGLVLFSNKEQFIKAIDMMSVSMDTFSKAIMQTLKDNIVRYDLKYSLKKV